MHTAGLILVVAGALLIAFGGARSAVSVATTGAVVGGRWATIARGTTPQGDPYEVRARPVRHEGSHGIKIVDEHARGGAAFIAAGSPGAFRRRVAAGVSTARVGGGTANRLVYGTLPRHAREVVVRLANGSGVRARDIAAPRPLRSLGVRFFVAELADPDVDPVQVLALDQNGERIAGSVRL